jgi:hypothetical protein
MRCPECPYRRPIKHRFWAWLSLRLPRRLAYYCAIRVVRYGITGKYRSTDAYTLTALKALDRWHDDLLKKGKK